VTCPDGPTTVLRHDHRDLGDGGGRCPARTALPAIRMRLPTPPPPSNWPIPAAAGAYDQAPVTLNVTDSSVHGVLAVPIKRARRARRGRLRRLVARPRCPQARRCPHRLFANTLVQVTGNGIAAGHGRWRCPRSDHTRAWSWIGVGKHYSRRPCPGRRATACLVRRAGGDRRPVRFRQEHPAAHHGPLDRPSTGTCCTWPGRTSPVLATGAVRFAGAVHRLVVPAVLPARPCDRREQRGAGLYVSGACGHASA